jgi:hypothetical protein
MRYQTDRPCAVRAGVSAARLALAALAGACAPAANAGPTPVAEDVAEARREVLRGGTGGVYEYHPDANRARVIDLSTPIDSLWPRLMAAYDRLGLPLGEVDTGARTLGTSSVRVVGRLGGTPLSEYLDCGPGPLGSRAADSYAVTLRAVTELHPVDSANVSRGTTVRTLLEAKAKANSTQGDPVTCVSTGRLETRVVRLMAAAPSASSR